jgi:hypothetical protein
MKVERQIKQSPYTGETNKTRFAAVQPEKLTI